MSSDELWEKFYDCGKRSIDKHDLLPLFERLETLERVANMRDVTRLLVPRATPGKAQHVPAFAPKQSFAAPAKGSTLQETSWVP
jgi:hypothetical protein